MLRITHGRGFQLVFANGWEAEVAAVPHDAGCASLVVTHNVYINGQSRGVHPDCDCTRDARIAKGIEAALAEYGAEVADVFSDGLVATANKAALAAFLKASQ